MKNLLHNLIDLLLDDPDLEVDAYGSATALISLIAEHALTKSSMGVGSEGETMKQILELSRR